MQTKNEIAAAYVRKYPALPSRAVARIIYRENKAVWPTHDACYQSVRIVKGAHGKHDRRYLADRSLETGPNPSNNPLDNLPEPKTEFDDWAAVPIAGDYLTLCLQDIHLPYYDKAAIVLALTMGKQRGCNLIFLNGDVVDHYSVSHWENDPRKRKFADELKLTKQFLDTLRAQFPKARIIWKLGNHEERYEKYMRIKAKELLDVEDFEFSAIYKLANYGIELIGEMRPVALGKLFVIHGHEYKFSISNPVNPARGLFLRAKTSATCGHFHQISQHSERQLDQKTISTWSAGCLCDLHPEYRPLNNWGLGFQIIPVNAAGDFEVENYRIINGVAYR